MGFADQLSQPSIGERAGWTQTIVAETADTANNRPTAAVCQGTAVGVPCLQTWVVTLKNLEGCTLTALDWTVPFRVVCSSLFTG